MMCLLLVCSTLRRRAEGSRKGVGGRVSISSLLASSSSATRGMDWGGKGEQELKQEKEHN